MMDQDSNGWPKRSEFEFARGSGKSTLVEPKPVLSNRAIIDTNHCRRSGGCPLSDRWRAFPSPRSSRPPLPIAGTPSQRGTTMSTVPPEVVKDLAPTGKLRAAINLGNPVLAQGTPQEPSGVTVDLARELARRAGAAAGARSVRWRRQGVRGAQGRGLGYRLPGDRAGARRRDRFHGALCDHRRRLHGAGGLGAEVGRRGRQRRRPHRRQQRLGLRPLSHPHAQARPVGSRRIAASTCSTRTSSRSRPA